MEDYNSRNNLLEQINFSSMFGGFLGSQFKDVIGDIFKSPDIPEDKKDEIADEAMDAHKKYLAQIVLTDRASSKVRDELEDLGILDEVENIDLSGFKRITRTKIRKEIEKGKMILNLKRLIF